MYKSLKEGWIPLSDICEKYSKDKGNMNRLLGKIDADSKEQIGRIWIVKESEIIKYIKLGGTYE